LAIVDPPYGCSSNWKNTGKGLISKNKLSKWDVSPQKEYFTELFRISKNQIIWGANFFTEHLPISDNWVCFQKYGIPSLPEFELAWTSTDVKNKVWGASRLDLNINYGKLIHPTQKPIKLYEWLLMNYAKEGDKILDTHLGSGSHALACWNLNFDLTAYELDADYFTATTKRIEKHTRQIQLF
jgi:site-specific DNA-methyltransferase (adenine-specific)